MSILPKLYMRVFFFKSLSGLFMKFEARINQNSLRKDSLARLVQQYNSFIKIDSSQHGMVLLEGHKKIGPRIKFKYPKETCKCGHTS